MSWRGWVSFSLLAVSVALLIVLPGIKFAERMRAVVAAQSPPPIDIPNATARWVSDREIDVEAPSFTWSDTCPSIWANWWVQTRWNGVVPVTVQSMKGPLSARGLLPPRYQLSITPKVGPALQLRATIPEWLPPKDVLLVGVDDTVPSNEPCESGWSGVIQIFRLQIEPRP